MAVYGNTADFVAYETARGNPTTGDVSAALQRASDYIRSRYVVRFDGEYTEADVVEATYIATRYELATPGFWSTTYTPAQQKVLTKVGDIQWTAIPGMSGSDGQLPVSPMIENILAPYVRWGLPAVMVV